MLLPNGFPGNRASKERAPRVRARWRPLPERRSRRRAQTRTCTSRLVRAPMMGVDVGRAAAIPRLQQWRGSAYRAEQEVETPGRQKKQTARTLEGILLADEPVEVAFKVVRDLFVFTDKRLILVDKQGLTSRKVDYLVVPYRAINSIRSKPPARWTWIRS